MHLTVCFVALAVCWLCVAQLCRRAIWKPEVVEHLRECESMLWRLEVHKSVAHILWMPGGVVFFLWWHIDQIIGASKAKLVDGIYYMIDRSSARNIADHQRCCLPTILHVPTTSSTSSVIIT